ncbi:MAG: serine--tRNA ligase [Candidatus Binatia bacterium]|nr:serine--tRNA ligase [Candidatus Binatia bacterium]MDG2009012.1 serine--tRNA ligase [Candidatus Binatia bacterium]
MLDIRKIRETPDLCREGLAKVQADPSLIDQVLELDTRRREALHGLESRRAERTKRSKEIGKLPPEERKAAGASVSSLAAEIADLEKVVDEATTAFRNLMLEIPNLPHPAVPEGAHDADNVVLRTEGTPVSFSFTAKPHWEIGPALGAIDFERGVKISGSRFYVLTGPGARLQRALISFMLDVHTREHDYVEIYPPAMVKEHCLVGTGNLPKFAEHLYRDIEGEHWWVPTAEVPVTNLYRDEVLPEADLPVRHVAYSPCFRREKMSAGRDVRGIKRGHQFDKVEMVKFVHPEHSDAELESLLGDAEDICKRLGLTYRVIQMCTGDLSFVAAIKFDIDVWAPGSEEWLEVSSCANFGDFQARRANLRFRPEAGGKPDFLHTLNGSGLALPRIMIAILETYQQEDGSVVVPEVLRPYLGGESLLTVKGE